MSQGRHRARRIRLVCGHDLWLVPPLPNLSDKLWCRGCVSYQEVGPGAAKTQKMYHDGWQSKPLLNGKIEGKCDACTYSTSERNFYYVEQRMWTHITAMHAHSSLISAAEFVEIPKTKRLPPGSEPPF